jgi:hypothetical protein
MTAHAPHLSPLLSSGPNKKVISFNPPGDIAHGLKVTHAVIRTGIQDVSLVCTFNNFGFWNGRPTIFTLNLNTGRLSDTDVPPVVLDPTRMQGLATFLAKQYWDMLPSATSPETE